MHTGHLRKHILAHYGLIGRNGYAGITLDQAADGIELALVDVGLGMKLVFQYHLNA